MKFSFANILFLPLAAIAADTNALPALAPAYGELPPTFWEQHQSTIIVGGFAFLAVASLFLRVWLRPEPSDFAAGSSGARSAGQIAVASRKTENF